MLIYLSFAPLKKPIKADLAIPMQSLSALKPNYIVALTTLLTKRDYNKHILLLDKQPLKVKQLKKEPSLDYSLKRF